MERKRLISFGRAFPGKIRLLSAALSGALIFIACVVFYVIYQERVYSEPLLDKYIDLEVERVALLAEQLKDKDELVSQATRSYFKEVKQSKNMVVLEHKDKRRRHVIVLLFVGEQSTTK
jgi:hypothetical protein